jgi:hypothetical protein
MYMMSTIENTKIYKPARLEGIVAVIVRYGLLRYCLLWLHQRQKGFMKHIY